MRTTAATLGVVLACLAGCGSPVRITHESPPQAVEAMGGAVVPAQIPDQVSEAFEHALTAIRKHDLAALKTVLDSGLSIDVTDDVGMSLLHWAASEGTADIAQYLIAHGISLNRPDSEGRTPVSMAALDGHTDVAILLAHAGATLDTPSAAAVGTAEQMRACLKKDPDLLAKTWYFYASSSELSLIQMAACHGNVAAIEELVLRGADTRDAGKVGFTPLMLAADWGRVDAVRDLLKHNPDINEASRYGWTALNSAARNGNVAVVELLLDRGATYDIFTAATRNDVARIEKLLQDQPDLVKSRCGGETPLGWAAGLGNEQAAVVLFDSGAEINVHDETMENSPLQLAAWAGRTSIVKLLLDRNANIEIGAGKDPYGTPLHMAACVGDVEVAQILLARGANINAVNNLSKTPLAFAADRNKMAMAHFLIEHHADFRGALHNAASEGHAEMVRLLIDAGANVDEQYAGAGSALNTAAERGDLEMVKLLLERDAKTTTVNEDGFTPLHQAAFCRDKTRHAAYLQIADLLLQHGAKIEARSRAGYTALHRAINSNANLKMIMYLLNHGADIKAQINYGGTPLHMACYALRADIVKLLLDHGADLNPADKQGGTPAHYLLAEKRPGAADILKILRDRGLQTDVVFYASPDDSAKVIEALDKQPELLEKIINSQTLLQMAAGKGDLELVKKLIQRGANIEADSASLKWTALHYAAGSGHAKVVEYLLAHGANPDKPDISNQRPLYTAAAGNHADVIKLLLKAGAKPNQTTNYGYTAMHAAASDGGLQAVQALFAGGGDINSSGTKSERPLHDAVTYGHDDVALFLLENGVEACDAANAYSPLLHSAASAGKVAVVKALLKRGVNVNRLNVRRDTALDWTSGEKNVEVIKALRDAGGLYGHEIPKYVAALIKQLDDESFAKREAADTALRGLGAGASTLLEHARKKDEPPEIKARLDQIALYYKNLDS